MQFFRLCSLIFAIVLIAAASPESPPNGADQPKPEQVERVPTAEAIAVLGHLVEGPDGKTIGRLVDVLVDGSGVPQAGVIDFGGFMGVGARKVAVHWRALHFAPGADPKHAITLELTPDQIKAAPEFRDVGKPTPVVVPAESAPVARVEATPADPAAHGAEPAQSAHPNGQ
jgi:hypothetical protein